MANTELDTAIADAAEQLKEKIVKEGGTVEEPSEESSEDSTIEDTENPEEVSESDLDDNQLLEAKNLYKALLDPSQRTAVLGALAAQAGLINSKTDLEDKKEFKVVKKGIEDIIKAALPEFPGLASKLAPAINEILEQERSERATEMEEVRRNDIQRDVDKAIESLRKETKGASKSLENRMAQLSNKISAEPGTGVDEYIHMLYTIASAGSSATRNTQQIADRIRRNANNAPDRLKNSSSNVPSRADIPAKKMSIKESVDWAIEQASKGRTRV